MEKRPKGKKKYLTYKVHYTDNKHPKRQLSQSDKVTSQFLPFKNITEEQEMR